MKVVSMVATGLLAIALAGCSGKSTSSQQAGQLANQTQALATQLQVAASVDAVKVQVATLTALGDQLSKLKGQIAGLPAATNLDAQITAVATLVSATQAQLTVELTALKAGTSTTYHNYSSSIKSITLQVKDIAADIAAGGTTSSLPVAQQLQASQLATAQVELVAMQSAINGLPTALTDAFNPQITTLTGTVTTLQQQVAGSAGMSATDLATLGNQVNTTIDQVSALIGSASIAAGDLANLSTTQQTQVATLTTLAASAATLANADVTAGADGDATVLQAQLDAANATITSLNTTITDLQSQLGTAATTISTQGSTITSQSGNIADLQTQIAAANSTIVTLNETITNLQTALGTANGTVTTQASTITDLQTQITTANATIAQLQDAVNSLNATVDALLNPPAPPLPIDFTVADNGTSTKTVVAKIAPGAASTLYFNLVSATGGRVTATLSSLSQTVDGDGNATVTINEYGAGKTYILTATTVDPNATTVAKAVTNFVVSDAVAAGAGTVVYQGSVTVSTMAVGWQATVPQANGGPVSVKSTVATSTGVYSIVTEGLYPTIYSHLEKRDPVTGNLLWATAVTIPDSFGSLYVSPAGDVFVSGVINGNLTMSPQTPYLAKVNPTNGSYTWTWNNTDPVEDLAFDAAGNNYVATGGRVVAVSAAGSTLWATGVINGGNQVAVKDATVYQVNTNFGVITVIARSAVSGAQLWSRAVFSGDISTTSYNSRSIAVTDALYIVNNAISYNGGQTFMKVYKVALDGTLVGAIYDFNTISSSDARLVVAGGTVYASYAASPVSFNVIKLSSTGYGWVATYPTPIGQSLQVGIVGTQLYSGGGTFVTRFNDLPVN